MTYCSCKCWKHQPEKLSGHAKAASKIHIYCDMKSLASNFLSTRCRHGTSGIAPGLLSWPCQLALYQG